MNQMLNPYIAGAPVVESSMFFGREDVFTWIERSLTGKFVDNILVLHGQRRVGKTSVLKQIPNFLPDHYIQVFFDLQGRTGTSLDHFLWWLASEITRTVNRELGSNLPRPDRSAFLDAEYLINEFLPGLKPALGDKVLLLTFDEFDSLDRPEIRETLARPLIAILRRLIEIDGLSFIFSIGSSGDKLENMQASYTDFFKSALYRKISFLTKDDCVRLITKPVEGVITYDPKAVDQIITITSGHPYFTQLLCHELFSLCQKTGNREISTHEVDAVLGDVIERGTVNLKFLWDEASDLEKWILAALAELDGAARQKLVQMLQAQKVRFSESDLNSALIHLQDKDVITKDYHFVIHLMRLWLKANRPMDRVREELVEVNPIANRYIEIGDEYRDRGQSGPAIDSYQQALAAAPGNLKAQLNIAAVYLADENYPEAVAAFELAMRIDDEDIVARTGYCDAHLVLAETAESRGEIDEAYDLYQAILVVNPAHADARQRLAAIYQQRAEDFLLAGQDDEALQAFNQALMLMPDDDQLTARYEEVLAEKKAKVVESLRQKAEKAAVLGNWSGVINAWESYLALEPDEAASIQPKLEHARKYAGLDADYEEAQQAIRQKHFGRAIELLQGVIVQDPSYRSASRLLAEAVEANKVRTPIWQRRGVIPAVIGVIVVVLGVLFGPQAWEALSTTLADFQTRATPTTSISQAKATATPEDQGMFSARALDFIDGMEDVTSNTSPNYLEDFSITNAFTVNEYTPPIYSISMGELRIQDDPPEEVSHRLWRSPDGVNAADFCLKFDFTPEVFEYGSKLWLQFRSDERGGYFFTMLSDGTWRFDFGFDSENGGSIDGQTADMNLGHPYQFLVCALGWQMAILLDGEPLVYWEDPTLAQGPIEISLNSYKPVQVVLDNIEFWDFQATQESEIPLQAKDFYQPIRNYLEIKAPTFYEDFSSTRPYMDEIYPAQNGGSLNEYLSDGRVYFSTQEAAQFEMLFPQLYGKNYALQIDFQPMSEAFDGLGIGNLEGYGFFNNLGFWELGTIDGVIQSENYNVGGHQNDTRTLLLIYYGSQLAAFLDGYFLGYVDGVDLSEDRQLVIMADSDNEVNVTFDNLKFWNLDGVEMSEVQGIPDDLHPTILDYIETYAPDFQEDFETPQPYWSEERVSTSDGEFFPLEELVQDGVLLIEDDVEEGASAVQIQFDQMQAKNMAVQFDFQPLDNNGYSTIGFHKMVPSESNGSPSGYLTRLYLETTEGGNYMGWLVEEQFPDGTTGYFPTVNIPINKGAGDSFQLLLIFYDDRYAAYLDGVRFDYMAGMQFSDQDILSIVTLTEEKLQFAVDNLKFWNLDGQVFRSDEEILQNAEQILNYVENELSPAFEEDFETPQPYWDQMQVDFNDTTPVSLSEQVADGSLQLHSIENKDYGNFRLNFPGIQGSAFAIQFDFQFTDPANSGRILTAAVDSNLGPGYPDGYSSFCDFYPDDQQLGCGLYKLTEGSDFVQLNTWNQSIPFPDIYAPHTMFVIFYDAQFFSFLDGTPLAYAEGLELFDQIISINIGTDGYQKKFDGLIDNIKFWNLDGVEIN